MSRFLFLLLMCCLLSACGQLVDADNWTSNRTLASGGGSLSLGRVVFSVPQGVLDEQVTLRITAEEVTVPGALGTAYRVHPNDLPGLHATVTWHYEIGDLPDGVYFVELAVARLGGDSWVPLSGRHVDPVAGIVRGETDSTGVFALFQLSDYGE